MRLTTRWIFGKGRAWHPFPGHLGGRRVEGEREVDGGRGGLRKREDACLD
jgi:hypothetical protein